MQKGIVEFLDSYVDSQSLFSFANCISVYLYVFFQLYILLVVKPLITNNK
jgi:hypothetical protein